MAKYKTLLVGSEWVRAGKKRKCYHNAKHLIVKGDDVLEVTVGLGPQGYCLACGEAMIQAALAALSLMKPISKTS